jgi:hypothetical protein
VTDYLSPPPLEKVIPVTRGCDRSFTLQRVNTSNTPVNFGNVTVYLKIDIDKAAPTTVNAVVSGSTAAFTIPDSVCDQVKTGTRWRAILDQGDLETPLLVGTFERHDG